MVSNYDTVFCKTGFRPRLTVSRCLAPPRTKETRYALFHPRLLSPVSVYCYEGDLLIVYNQVKMLVVERKPQQPWREVNVVIVMFSLCVISDLKDRTLNHFRT